MVLGEDKAGSVPCLVPPSTFLRLWASVTSLAACFAVAPSWRQDGFSFHGGSA